MAAKRLVIAAGIVVIAYATAGSANDTDPGSDVRTDDVVVTASRFEEEAGSQPIGVQVIPGEQVRSSGARTLQQFLTRSAGIYSRDNSGSPNQQIDMRGFGITGDQNTLILLDGQRISEPQLASADLASIPLSSIDRIEILRGSGAVLYGGGATAGTINIITTGPRPDSRRASIKAGGGTYNTYEASAAASIASEQVGATFNVARFHSDNYRDNNELDQRSFQGDFRYFGNNGPVYLKLNLGEQDLRLPGDRTEAQLTTDRRGTDTPNDFSTLRSSRVNLGTSQMYGSVEAAIDLSYRERDSFARFDTFSTDYGIEGNETALTPRVKIPFTLGVEHELVTGIDLDEWDYTTSSLSPGFTSVIVTEQTNSAFYLKDTFFLTDATQMSIGGRVQRTDTTIDAFNNSTGTSPIQEQVDDLDAWEVALRQQFNGGVSIYAKTGTSFRVANLDELGFVIRPLEPQTSQDTEIGADFGTYRSNARVAAYHMDIENEISLLPANVFPGLGGANVNLPPTLRQGFELEGQWNTDDWFILSGQYTYTEAKFREGVFRGVNVTGNNIPLVPRHRAGLTATVLPAPSVSISGTVTYVGEQYFDNDQSNSFGQQMPDYTVVDLAMIYYTGNWKLEAIARNLFDEDYFSYGFVTNSPTFTAYPAFERNFLLSAQYLF